MTPPNTQNTSEKQGEALNFPFTIETREQLAAAAAEIARKQRKLETLRTKQANAIAKVQGRFAQPLDDLAQSIREKLDAAFSWCAKNEATAFAETKTIAFPAAIVDFKVCPPSVRELPGWTVTNILAALKRWRKWGKYVRVKFEIDRTAILADRDKFKPWQWRKHGLSIEQAHALTITSTASTTTKASMKR